MTNPTNSINLYDIFDNTLVLDRDAIERLRKALNQYIAHEIQTNHGGKFALDVIMDILAVGVFNQNGNLSGLLDGLASAAATLHYKAGMPYDLAHELQKLSEKLYPALQPTNPPDWNPPEPINYPIDCVLVHLQTGEAIRVNLYEEEIEIKASGARHDRDTFMSGEDYRLKYKIVVLENSES